MPFLPLLSNSFSSSSGSAVSLWSGKQRPPFFCRFPEGPASSPAWWGGGPRSFSRGILPFLRRSCTGGNGMNAHLPLPATPSGTSEAGGLPGAWDLWPLADWEHSLPGRSASAPPSARRRAEAVAFREEGAELSWASRRSTVKDTV